MNNIKKIYQHAGKCDNQQNLKDIIDAAVLFTPEDIKDEITSFPMTQTTVNKPSARKSLCLFTKIFYVKRKAGKLRIGAAKSKRRSMKVGNSLRFCLIIKHNF